MWAEVEQNTDEWLQMRSGLLTMSNLGLVMANLGKKFGEPAKKLAVRIAVEQITGKFIQGGYSNADMDRGHEQEPIAIGLYEQERFIDVDSPGFYSDGSLGGSPDGLVGDDGLIEVKSSIAHIHYNRIKSGNIEAGYKWQCWGNLMLSERKWIDFVSYCSEFPEGRQLHIQRLVADHLPGAVIRGRVKSYLELVAEIKGTVASI